MPGNEAVCASVVRAQHRSDKYFITVHPHREPVPLVRTASHVQEIIKDSHRQIRQICWICTVEYHLCSGRLQSMSQGPNFRRVIAEYADPSGPGQFGTGDHMSGREPLEENRVGLPGRDKITGRSKLGYLAHRPLTIDRLRHRHGEPTTQPNRKGTAEQPHIARIAPAMRHAIRTPNERR
jgi:hypothetical protein